MSRQRRRSLHQKVANSLCARTGDCTGREEEKLDLVSPWRLPPCAVPGPATLSPDAGASAEGAVTAPPCLPTEPLGRARRGAVRGPADTHGPLPTPKPARPSHLPPLPLHGGCHAVTRTPVTMTSGSGAVPDTVGDPQLLTEGINAFK